MSTPSPPPNCLATRSSSDIKRRLTYFNIQTVRKRESCWGPMERPLILKLVLAGAFYPNYFSRTSQNANAECEAVKTLAGCSPYCCVYVQNMPHPAPIYLDQVKDFLKANEIAEGAQFFHDDSRKLVIAFDSNKDSEMQEFGGKYLHMNIPGEIVMPLYRAIKLRQLNMAITIKTVPPHVAKEELKKLSLHSKTSMLSETSVKKPVIRLDQLIVKLNIVHMENGGHFFAHILPNLSILLQLESILQPNLLRPVIGEVVEGVLYAAPFSINKKTLPSYYRAKIKKKYIEQSQLWVEVLFIDFGNSLNMHVGELRESINLKLQEELEALPYLALECVLAEVCPSVWSNQGGYWSTEANIYVRNCFRQLKSSDVDEEEKGIMCQVYSYVNGVASLIIYLEDNVRPSETAPLTLNSDLINKGFAMYKEESYLSKLNHARREQARKKGEINQNYFTVNEDDNSASKYFTKDFSSLPTTSGRSIVNLKGPNSPLEMKVFSVVHSCTQKDVRLEWNSVNSVLLDSDPSDPHERLVVAGSVSQSPDGRKLTLNHTTVLPNIHGLAALICLIFAPTVELRVNDCYSRYTGALCGLGMEEGGIPLFTENDIEVIFDVEFTNQDITLVNKLRYWINQRFCSEDADVMDDGHIKKIQSSIREHTFSLLKTVRRSFKLYRNPNPFMWGKIPKYRITSPFTDAQFSDSKFIYKMHWGVILNPENDRAEVEELVKKLSNVQNSLDCGLTPRNLKCDLCDLDFEYCCQLRLHLTEGYHLQLFQWLKSRAIAHKIALNSSNSKSSQ